MLYANGCSFTYGTGLALKDKAWPFILGEKLGISKEDVQTDAERGISNLVIYKRSIELACSCFAGRVPIFN